VARSRADLDVELAGRVVLLVDDLAAEQLTPIDYPFYGNPEHAAIVDRLISARPRVVLAGTGTAPATAGALEPFPLIEDGRFPVPTGNLTLDDAAELAEHAGEQVRVDMSAHRWPSTARNVRARLGPQRPRVLVVAHLDSKPGTPGAVDNASGVTTLLLLARALQGWQPQAVGVELLAVNGEDSYSAAGELAYLEDHGDALDQVLLVVNVDGVGHRSGGTAYSCYQLPDELDHVVRGALDVARRVAAGPQWFSSDHMVFVPRGRPAVALTSEHLDLVLREVAHSAHDTPAQVEVSLLTDLADGLSSLVRAIDAHQADA
jgi:aminopeptidase YwaD